MCYIHAGVHAVEHGRTVERAAAFISEQQPCALLYSPVNLGLDAHGRLLADKRAHGSLRVHGIADPDGLYFSQKLFDKLVMHAAVDYEALRNGADLTGHVESAAGRSLCDGIVDIGVGTDYHGRVSAQLKALVFKVAAAVFRDAPAGGGAAGEIDAGDAVVSGEPLAHGLATAGNALVCVAGEARLVHQLRKLEHGERIVACGLDDATVAAEQGRRRLLGKEHQGRVERYYADYCADGLADRYVKVVFHAGLYAKRYGSAAEVVLRGGNESLYVSLEAAEVVVRLPVRLAYLLALDQRKLAVVLLLHNEVDELLHHGNALMQRHPGPGLLAINRHGNGSFHVLFGRGGHGVDNFAGSGI